MGRRLFTLVVIVVIAVVLVGVIGYAAFYILAGSGEASQGIEEVVSTLDAPDGLLYEIDPERSTARFEIAEVLRGADIIVEGTTNDVGGQISVNFDAPEESQVGEIVINARTLRTDNEDRNRALRTVILQSADDAYEFITFTPTELTVDSQSNESIVVGTVLELSVEGNLHVVEATRRVT
ncbi:MAG: YceI family protein, partial [Anaerolineae bacterium]|nr:YceI family protein [Anaerolineae bacterium]